MFIFDKAYMRKVIYARIKEKMLNKKILIKALVTTKATDTDTQYGIVRKKLDPSTPNIEVQFYKNICKLLDIKEEDLFIVK